MDSRDDWCAQKSSNLLEEDLRIPTLNEIKDHLTTIPKDEALRTANCLNLPLVFDCLNDSNTEQVDLACEVLSLCLGNLSLGESTNRYGVSLERALTHPYAGVKLMALKEIERNFAEDEILIKLTDRVGLVTNIIQCVGDDDLAVVSKASEIIKRIALTSYGIQKLIGPEFMCAIKSIIESDEVRRLRMYELLIDISRFNQHSFNILNTTDLITNILKELEGKDLLVLVNIIEILTKLGLCRHGLDFLESNGSLDKIFNLCKDDDTVCIELCEPVILKFFGNVTHWKPLEFLSKYPQLFDRLFANIESRDLTIVGISLDTLGHIGSSNQGKIALDSTGNKIVYAIKTIVILLSSLPTEFRIRALNCIENLLNMEEHKMEISNICRKWYHLLGEIPLELVMKYAKNPFSEIRIAGFGILKAVIGHRWGQEEVKNMPGLIEFLLDRSAEVIKECKEIKYEIVVILSQSDVFDLPTQKRLQTFVKEGPFYVQAVTEIAIEGNE